MHTMNGIDLSGAEYRELRDLVRLETEGGDPAGHAAKSIAGGGSSLYRSLGDKGLIEYEIADLWKWAPHFLGLTPKGRSFIEDTDAASLRDRESRRSDRRFAIVCAVAGAVSGAIAGGLVSLAISLLI